MLKLSIPKKLDAWIIFLLTLAVFSLLKFQQFLYFAGVNAEMIDWYETTLWNFLNGKFFAANHVPLFSEHFSPIIILLFPVYLVFQSPYSLILLHALILSLPVFPLYYIASHHFEIRFIPVGICLTYFFSRTLNFGLMFDFHLEIFYPVLLFCILFFYLKQKWAYYYLFLILCLMVKEDAAIPVIGLGIYLYVKSFRKHGIITALSGLVWLLLSVELIIPYYRSLIGKENYGFWTYWSGYGGSQKEILLGMLNPLKNYEVIFTPEKLNAMFNYFSVYLFMPLGSVTAFLFLIFPNWFLLFSSNNPMMYNVITYYGLLSLPFLLFSTVVVMKKIAKKYSSPKVIIIITALLLIVNAANSRYWKLFVETPMKYNSRYETAKTIISTIPLSATISAQGNLVGHIPPRDGRVFFPQDIDKSEYIFIDEKGDKWPLNEESFTKQVTDIKNSGIYKIETEKDSFILFKMR